MAGDITSNLVAHWKLDETSGTSAADSSGGGYTGTYVNTPTLGAGGALGGASKAVTFATASSQKVNATNPVSAYPFTVALWAKPTDISGQRDILALRTTLGTYRIEQRTDGTCRLFRYDGTTNNFDITKASTFAAGVWVHVCVVHASSTSCSLYVNAGTPVTGTTAVNYTGPTTVDIAYGNAYFNGTIDDVRIYSRAFAADDVTLLYAYREGRVITPGLQGGFQDLVGGMNG